MRLDLERLRGTRAEAFAVLHAEGIGVNVHYIPVHTQPYFRQLGFTPGQYPNAEAYYANALTLPLHLGLTEAQPEKAPRGRKKGGENIAGIKRIVLHKNVDMKLYLDSSGQPWTVLDR